MLCMSNVGSSNNEGAITTIKVHQINYLKIFPGQTITINETVIDFFGAPSSCMADYL